MAPVNTHTTGSGADSNIPAERLLIPRRRITERDALGNVHPLARGEFDRGVANPECSWTTCCWCLSRRRKSRPLSTPGCSAAGPGVAALSPMAHTRRIRRAVRRTGRRIGAGDGVARCARIHSGRDSSRPKSDCVFRNGGRGIRRVSRGDPPLSGRMEHRISPTARTHRFQRRWLVW